MLFDRRVRTINRLLIVEDEPILAFENEHQLTEAGFTVVGTVDRVEDAVRVIEKEPLHLVLADIRLSDEGDGFEVAHAARRRDVPVLFVSGYCPVAVQQLAIGCLAKPYRARDLLAAIDVVDARLQGRTRRRLPPGLTLYPNED